GPVPPLTSALVSALAHTPSAAGTFSVVEPEDAAAVGAPLDDQLLLVRLRAGGAELGVAVVRGESFGFAFDRIAQSLLVAAHTAAALEAADDRRPPQDDSVTGLLSRRGFREAFAAELDRCTALLRPLTIALFDCDDFERINDL